MMPATFADLIGTWPRDEGMTSIATFAADMGVPYYHAQTMRYRSSISVEKWPDVIAAAKKRGFGITHDDLAKMRGRRRGAKGSKPRPTACFATG
jgi:hypothetical protein